MIFSFVEIPSIFTITANYEHLLAWVDTNSACLPWRNHHGRALLTVVLRHFSCSDLLADPTL